VVASLIGRVTCLTCFTLSLGSRGCPCWYGCAHGVLLALSICGINDLNIS
jgi:hypothetical protein